MDIYLKRLNSFRVWNLIAALFHAASASLMLYLANDFTIPITAQYTQGAPGSQAIWPTQILFEPSFTLLTVAFLYVSAFFHLLVCLPGIWDKYTQALKDHRAPFRWLEYTISSSIMLLPIALLTGISDIATLIALVGVNMAMIWFGYIQEYVKAGDRLGMKPYWLGCAAGIVPWVAIGIYLIGAGGGVPGFVYGIYISLFLLFNCFALVMLAHCRGWGRYGDYLVGEKTYIILSFVAKSALAWQVFAGALAG